MKRTSELPVCSKCGLSDRPITKRVAALEAALERIERLVKEILANQYPRHMSDIERR
jgi:hypothetical protein